MSYGALGSTGFGAAGGPAWYQVWSAGNKWAGWLWADAAAAQRVANTSDSVIRTASGQQVGRPYHCKPSRPPGSRFTLGPGGLTVLKPECR